MPPRQRPLRYASLQSDARFFRGEDERFCLSYMCTWVTVTLANPDLKSGPWSMLHPLRSWMPSFRYIGFFAVAFAAQR